MINGVTMSPGTCRKKSGSSLFLEDRGQDEKGHPSPLGRPDEILRLVLLRVGLPPSTPRHPSVIRTLPPTKTSDR